MLGHQVVDLLPEAFLAWRGGGEQEPLLLAVVVLVHEPLQEIGRFRKRVAVLLPGVVLRNVAQNVQHLAEDAVVI